MKRVIYNLLVFAVALTMFTDCNNEPEITPQEENQNVIISNGAITAAFSVSSKKQVYFSQGNLQYQASTNTWRFAQNQYDMIGEDNANISETYDGWIDLFGWGTSSYNGKYPYMTNYLYSDYANGLKDISGTNYDWGLYNKISNGGEQTKIWRTLTYDEWDYIIFSRSKASSKKGVATVNNINGLIILPDNWTLPSGMTFTSGVAESYNSDYFKTINSYTLSDWEKMEKNGAIFLPVTGERFLSQTRNKDNDSVIVAWTNYEGNYWSSTVEPLDGGAYYLMFDGNYVGYGLHRSNGLSVRLVQDVKK